MCGGLTIESSLLPRFMPDGLTVESSVLPLRLWLVPGASELLLGAAGFLGLSAEILPVESMLLFFTPGPDELGLGVGLTARETEEVRAELLSGNSRE